MRFSGFSITCGFAHVQSCLAQACPSAAFPVTPLLHPQISEPCDATNSSAVSKANAEVHTRRRTQRSRAAYTRYRYHCS